MAGIRNRFARNWVSLTNRKRTQAALSIGWLGRALLGCSIDVALEEVGAIALCYVPAESGNQSFFRGRIE